MRLLPIDLANARFTKAKIGGYRFEEVDALMDRAAQALEELTAENEELRTQLLRQRHELDQMRGEERLVKDAIVSAQRASELLRSDAGREADLIREEARQQARADRSQAQRDAEALQGEVERLGALRRRFVAEQRAYLEKALRELEEIESPASPPAADPPAQPYPTRLGATKPLEPIIVEDEEGEKWVS